MLDMVHAVRPVMEDNELYSPSDLASILEQPIERVTRVLEFLKRYNFADQITRREMLFRKTAATVGLCDALRVLQKSLGDAHAIDAGQVASASKINRQHKHLLDVGLRNRISRPKDPNWPSL